MPASPQQNGKHERMHRTLKAEATRPAKANLRAQQRTFDEFRHIYNDERPHSALNGKTPQSLYRESNRSYNGGRQPPFEYPGHFIIKRVTASGTFRFKDRLLFIGHPLDQQLIGLEEVDDGVWSIHFCHVLLARVDERDFIIRG
jgi:hypothetical protein